MSSSGLIYAVIVGAWAAYLVPMWLRRQDELNEARPTERFSTAIRLLSGRAGMERRYARDLKARSTEEGEPDADPDVITDSVDVRAFAVPPREREDGGRARRREASPAAHEGAQQVSAKATPSGPAKSVKSPQPSGQPAGSAPRPGSGSGKAAPGNPGARRPDARPMEARVPGARTPDGRVPGARKPGALRGDAPARGKAATEAAARARRSKVLARRRRTTTVLFLAFTLGSIVAAVGGLAFLWAPGVPAVLLSVYIAHLRAQERRRFTYTMDRRRAEAAAQQLRERESRRRHTAPVDDQPEAVDESPEPEVDPGLSALAADRRALVEQTDHAEWVDQQKERQRGPGRGDSWDPVPVPLPTYVTAPVAPRATSDVDLGSPDAWSSARSSAAEPAPAAADADAEAEDHPEPPADDARSDARRAASARRARERGRTPLFDQYAEGDRPRAANE
ncbi:gephyrin-like molybdotransferase receptor GlpR [Streptomyces cavernae]|uniref:divisome protein SepX/GlpR n=1 Tax=Streptomyces cavernae TaxID=2259034 RepID=UPI000FEB99CF|nr:gephyrin-like molybdotransferase receptor GlpR [Streptomyces cavernae]